MNFTGLACRPRFLLVKFASLLLVRPAAFRMRRGGCSSSVNTFSSLDASWDNRQATMPLMQSLARRRRVPFLFAARRSPSEGLFCQSSAFRAMNLIHLDGRCEGWDAIIPPRSFVSPLNMRLCGTSLSFAFNAVGAKTLHLLHAQ
ncbi:hypothetical protein K438DRAFT_967224 [Mycena galopus ATCC 62051]|nr:hypothetical protein K438DRAFT_967224 [Mycena galopus ATCC 62051]